MHAAHDAAMVAARSAMAHYKSGIAVQAKGDGSPVTEADRGAERAVREWIAQRFPADGILGEEFPETPGTSGRRWIVDPIDGTKSFVRGVPLWGSLVALMEGDRVLAGAAAFPAAGESIAAAPGCGTWHDGVRARVSTVADLAASTVLITDALPLATPALRDVMRFVKQTALQRTWGDCYGYLLVATGRAEVMIDAILNPWDAACFLPIIEEAGGVFSDLRGARTVFGGDAVATNTALASAARRTLGITDTSAR
jgi:histidinol phosphatase-like enzyme (inositol monophosphatase family)